jgi:hypothetical protein
LKIITQSEAMEALNQVRRDDRERFSIVGEPDHLGPVTVFFVRVWDGEDVDFEDVMFYRKNGKVKVYEGR